ncbi:NAD(+) synthase [Candidatus Halobeggiatoa sp. HSG11]|nr:NAD(+) synthase [Candidatus Halobeggiatoa sp. HSG11]
MKYIKVGSASLNQTPLNWNNNKNNIIDTINTAKNNKINILCLPELCISGYGCEDAFLAPGTLNQSLQVLDAIVPHTKDIIVAVGLPLLHQNRIYNTVALLANGKISGFVVKRFLPNDGIHYEKRWFHTFPHDVQTTITIDNQQYPIGDIYFDCGGVRIGFEICEEAWVADRPGIKLAAKGVDIILNPSASHFAFGKHEIRKRFMLEGSRAFSVSYIYANLLGNEAGRAIYDGDAMIASGGQMLASSKRFSFKSYQLIDALIDIDLTSISQARTSDWQPANCIHVPFNYFVNSPQQNSPTYEAWEISPNLKEEEFTRAVTLGLFDYLRKTHSQGFVISLSGGADSSAIACLVRLMVEQGVAELGTKEFGAKIGFAIPAKKTITNILQLILTCVYQATENSSKTTKRAASTLANNLGAKYMELDVDSLVKDYVDKVSYAIKHKLNWQDHDIALQNIQARVRSPSVWLIANLNKALLLATSNRSEVALGYATMDGDTSGGLSPLAGIDKDFLRHWLRWLEQEGPMNLSNIPALALVNQQAPTAELRPPDMQQKDEDDLMPYPLLNMIEKAAIRDRQTPYEIFCLLQIHFDKYEKQQLLTWIERFFTLWSRNQWKRERFAPSFHLDDTNLDPKTWYRFPILSGGYEEELAEMRRRA